MQFFSRTLKLLTVGLNPLLISLISLQAAMWIEWTVHPVTLCLLHVIKLTIIYGP